MSVINVPEREGPKDISQTEGSRESAPGRGSEEDRWVRKKRGGGVERRVRSGEGAGFLLGPAMFPIM